MDIKMENNKKSVIKSLAINEKDTGSSEIQIGLLTQKIDKLSKHFKKFKKDKHSSLGLLKVINRRKRLLKYLKNHNVDSYNNILNKLNLRK
jgi:small subunit ribosomal protein S15